ncbi:MAG: threonylcarbamoyl-AMP synthase [Gemmatimonadetes bacterium]|nr:threonylcarbamoyl-AMP synthase [Gemmatimonadota bacterium]
MARQQRSPCAVPRQTIPARGATRFRQPDRSHSVPPADALPRILVADPADPTAFAAAIDEGAAVIRAGGLVAFPTETVYGLGANALSETAVQRIYAAKGRPAFNPLIVHLADASQLPTVARAVPPVAHTLAQAFWPGPLTLVLPRVLSLPDAVSAGLDTVGVRVPSHPVAHALIARAGVPIAAPSANAFTRVSATTAAHVVAQLGAAVDLVLDGGATSVGIESTVVDVTGERPVLLRLGGVTREALERVIGPVDVVRHAPTGEAPRPSPGMIDRHYAPRARLHPFADDDRPRVWGRLAALEDAGVRTGLVAFDVEDHAATVAIEMPRDASGYARMLYAALHALDAAGCSVAFVEAIPDGDAWEAIADRLRRAGLAPPGDT